MSFRFCPISLTANPPKRMSGKVLIKKTESKKETKAFRDGWNKAWIDFECKFKNLVDDLERECRVHRKEIKKEKK